VLAVISCAYENQIVELTTHFDTAVSKSETRESSSGSPPEISPQYLFALRGIAPWLLVADRYCADGPVPTRIIKPFRYKIGCL